MAAKFHEMTIDDYLSALGSTAPAPGGGAAAGLIGAQACALAEMVSRLTAGSKNCEAFKEQAEQYTEVFKMARSIFLDLMDDDAENFRNLMKVLQSPKPKDPSDTSRKEALEEAFKKSAEAPMQMAQTMADLLPSFTQLLLHCNKNVITDAIIAGEEAMSCIRAAKLNVQINAKYVKDEFYAHETETTIQSWENAISAIDAVLTYQVSL